ncbi:T9SS type A sorting domain-containing protein [Spirosoma sp. BT702]|uniref:T9SS type A sorting domain-containing protein n=1 Tax=Spirosoma profusum TaxID=2771354 RepID=A0A927ASW8_9BACT|nr:sialate O-acetylesterase [Spirosoma profusum]MBD2704533.1 T9SS type A sorting domain-containing protein [Spirosoma profusum]
MKQLYASLILFLYYFSANAQLTFEQAPRNLQLYPRNEINQAEVVISGKITELGYTKIAVQVLREGVLTSMVSQTLAAAANDATFRLASIIKAEPAEYTFRVFLYKNADSTLFTTRERIVCGDIYVIHGQSNALAAAGLETLYSTNFDDKYLRNCTYPFGVSVGDIPAFMSWYPAKTPFGSVGGFGLTIQRLILQTHGIPTCMINGAQGGTGIADLAFREAHNHASLNTFYGRLLYRTQWAANPKAVKAIIWKQGEEDAGMGVPGYDAKFATLYNQFRDDYGDCRIYVGQINIMSIDTGASLLRDFQRRTKYLFKNVETIATIGTPGFDGVHYDGYGNQQVAFEQFRQISRDIYGSNDTLQINSPDIKKAFYNTRKDSISLVFDDQMQMVWKADTTFHSSSTGDVVTRQQKDFFYLDQQPDWVTGGVAHSNRIVLGLKQPASAKTLRYLPDYFADMASTFYDGPTLKNTRGMRAFSFDNVPIADAIEPVALAARPLEDLQIQLNWTPSANAQTQVLERADGTETEFKPIASLNGTVNTFIDTLLPDPFGTYYYRLRAFSTTSESLYSNVVNARPFADDLTPGVRLYPNPIGANRVVNLVAYEMTFTKFILYDITGRIVKSWQGTARTTLSLSLDGLQSGTYIARVQTASGQIISQKVSVLD